MKYLDHTTQIDHKFSTPTAAGKFIVARAMELCIAKVTQYPNGISFLLAPRGLLMFRHQTEAVSISRKHMGGSVCMLNSGGFIIDACHPSEFVATIHHATGAVEFSSEALMAWVRANS